MLKDRVELTRSERAEAAPGLAMPDDSPLASASLPAPQTESLSEELQQSLIELEIESGPGLMPRSAVEKITGEILPRLGAVRGCVFLRESADSPLEPKLYFGDYGPIFRGSGSRAEKIARTLAPLALPAKNALEGSHYDNPEKSIQYALCRIGGSPAVGVIYLEIGETVDSKKMDGLLAAVKEVSGSLANFLSR